MAILNENALSNIFVDVDFLEAEFKRIGREHVNVAFAELRQVPIILHHSYPSLLTSIVQTITVALNNVVQEYLVPNVRQASYPAVKPKRLQSLLEKLAKFGSSSREPIQRERGEKRRKEAEAVGRL